MPVCTSRYISRTYTYARPGDFRMHFPLFSSLSLFLSSRRAHTALSLFLRLPLFLPLYCFSLFVRASHGSIIRYVSNFRLSEFFARSFRIIPAALRKKYRTFSVESLRDFSSQTIFIYHKKCLNFA